MAKITLAIPFYSGLAFLRRALDSVVRQTRADWQVVVSDDAGPEAEARDLVASYGDRRLRYYRNAVNLGMVGNWNRCLDLAETDLVTLLHADDELLDNYCGLMVAAGQRFPGAAAFFCGTRIIDGAGRRKFSFPDFVKGFLMPPGRRPVVLAGEKALAAVLRGNFIMCPTLCYRRSVLGGRRFAAGWRFAQDLELTARLLGEGETLVGLRETAYAYRRHEHNATVAYTANLCRFQEEARLYDAIRAASLERRWTGAAAVAGRKSIIKLNLGYCALLDLVRLQPRQAWQKGALLGQLL
jgi:glycosyltransferase involved in cell wall biosynthesis